MSTTEGTKIMNLKAIQSRKATADQQQAQEIARRSRAGGSSEVLFKNVAPVVALLKTAPAPASVAAKASAVAAPASTNDVARVVKALADGFAGMAAAVKGSAAVQKATVAPVAATKTTSAPSAAPAQRSTGNPPSVPLTTETMRRKEAEAKKAAHKSAQKVAADRELVTKGTARVLAFRALDVSLSDNALLVLNHVVTAWEAADRRAVPVSFSAAGDALKMSFAAVRDAVIELTDKRALIRSVDSAGIARFMPGLGITGARQ